MSRWPFSGLDPVDFLNEILLWKQYLILHFLVCSSQFLWNYIGSYYLFLYYVWSLINKNIHSECQHWCVKLHKHWILVYRLGRQKVFQKEMFHSLQMTPTASWPAGLFRGRKQLSETLIISWSEISLKFPQSFFFTTKEIFKFLGHSILQKMYTS